MGGACEGGLNMLWKKSCEGVRLLVKLPAISLQLLKMNFFTHIFHRFWPDFKILFIVLFLGIISWKVTSRFNGGVCFSDGGIHF